MQKVVKMITCVFMILTLLTVSAVPASAASGTCEIFYFTYSGAVGEGGSASIQSSLSNLGYTANRYANTHAYYVRRTMDSDKIFAVVSHGSPGRIYCKDGVTTMSAEAVSSDDNNYSLAAWFGSGNLSGMLFAYYGACYSGATSSTYGNLLTYTTETLGANSALGFTESVYNSQATWYEAKLFSYLEQGYTLYVSDLLARSSTYGEFGSYGAVDSAVISGVTTTKIS